MRKLTLLFAILFNLAIYAQAEILPKDIQIKTAVLAAPEGSRDGAKVYGYDQDGKMVVLREGTNNMICIADDPNFDGIQVACYSDKLEPFMARGRELKAEGKSEIEKRKIRAEEADSGKLKMPDSPSTLYVFSGSEEN